MVPGAEIDLWMFPKDWMHGFALLDGARPSVHVFDAAGDAQDLPRALYPAPQQEG